MDSLKITALGGGSEIGASCYLLQAAGKNILLDAGVKMGIGSFSYPAFHLLPSLGLPGGLAGVDMVLVTHAHLDHLGALPVVVRENPEVEVVAPAATLELLRPMLMQLAGQVSVDGFYYDDSDLARVTGAMRAVDDFGGWGRAFSPFYDDSLLITAYPAGHVAGAACYYLQLPGGTVLYTGDFCLRDQWTVRGMSLPVDLRVDYLVMETTYGNGPVTDTGRTRAAPGAGFYRQIWPTARKVLNAGGKVLFPAFALSRAQEVICCLKYSMAADKLYFKTYVDGLAKEICRIYEGPGYREYWPENTRELVNNNLLFSGLDLPAGPAESRATVERVISGGPSCIVASSGQLLPGTASALYAEQLLGGEDNLIVLTGYQTPGSPGESLYRRLPRINLGGRLFDVRCRVEHIPMSGHAQIPEMMDLVQHLQPREIVLVHGDMLPGRESVLEDSLSTLAIPFRRLEDGYTLCLRDYTPGH